MPIIDPTVTSEQEINQFLQSYAAGSGAWADFYRGSAGQTIIGLMSGIGAFATFKAEIARREMSIVRARRASSILSLARALGYTVNRKRCAIMDLTVRIDSGNPILSDQIPALYVNGLPFAVGQTLSLVPGSQIVRVYQGEWKTVTLNVSAAEDFKFFSVDEDVPYSIDMNQVQVTINGTVMNTTQYVEDMLDASYITTRTAITGGLEIVTGDGIVGYEVQANDTIEVRYLVTTGLMTAPADYMQEGQLTIPNIMDVAVIDRGANEDDIEKVRTLSPRYYQTLRRAVTPYDYETIAEAYGGIINASATHQMITNTFTAVITYVKEDRALMTQTEKDLFTAYIAKFGILGQNIKANDPTQVLVDVHVQVKYTGPAYYDLQTLVRSKISVFEDKLGIVFKAADIVKKVYEIDGIERVYIKTPSIDRQLQYFEYAVINTINVELIDDDNIVESMSPDAATGYH